MAPVARPTCLALRVRTRPATREYGATFHPREHRVSCPSGPYVVLTSTVGRYPYMYPQNIFEQFVMSWTSYFNRYQHNQC